MTEMVERDPAASSTRDYAWRGEGPEPARWWHEDGTLVYRSYEDYCDD